MDGTIIFTIWFTIYYCGGWRMVNRRSHFVLRQRAFAMYNNTTSNERQRERESSIALLLAMLAIEFTKCELLFHPCLFGFITYFSYDYVSFVRCICDCGLSLSCVSVSNVSDMHFILYAAAKFTLISLCSLFVCFLETALSK